MKKHRECILTCLKQQQQQQNTTCDWYTNRYKENAASIFLTNQANKFKVF